MKKLKTKKAAAKRFTVTKTGKICCSPARHKHLLEHQSSNTKRKKRKLIKINKSDLELVKYMLHN